MMGFLKPDRIYHKSNTGSWRSRGTSFNVVLNVNLQFPYSEKMKLFIWMLTLIPTQVSDVVLKLTETSFDIFLDARNP